MIKRYIDVTIAVVSAALMPIKATLILVAICIALDTCFGLYKAYKTKTPITSRGLSAVISKMFLYEFVVILLFFIDSLLLNDLVKMLIPVELFLTRLVGIILVGVEVLSIHENIKIATGFDFIDMAKQVLKRGKSIKEGIEDIAK
jgi:hypothetical protein